MVSEVIFSPHYDFFIDKISRPSGYDMKTFHFHKKYEIYYAVEGPRRYYIEDASYIVNPGDVVLIGQDSVHKATSVENMPHARYVLNFNHEYLQEIHSMFPSINLYSCFEYNLRVLQLSPRKQEVIESLLRKLWECREQSNAKAIAVRKIHLAELLTVLDDYAAAIKEKHLSQSAIQNPMIEKIQMYISANYKECLSLSSIAAQFYISPHYLSRLFRKVTNLSIVEYINSIRLIAAKNMLENTSIPVALIAEENGFTTTTHFCRVFKSGTGMPPQQYRKLYRAENLK